MNVAIPAGPAGDAGLPGAVALTPGVLKLIRLFVSCGNEVERLRDIASDVVRRVDHILVDDLDTGHTVKEWDFRLDPPREEPVGHIADRSLYFVERSDVVIAIIGASVPPVTHQEIRRVFELRAVGRDRELWVFSYRKRARNPAASGPPRPTLKDLVKEMGDDFGTQVMYQTVKTELEFQAALMAKLVPYALRRASSAFGPVSGMPS